MLQFNFSPSHFIPHHHFTGTTRLTSLSSLPGKVVWPAEARRGEEREDEDGRMSLYHPSWTNVKRGQVRAWGGVTDGALGMQLMRMNKSTSDTPG